MRHLVKGRKLGRSTPHRKATLQALANALIEHKRIKTTLPKAKELRRFIEPLITKSKTDTTHNRRQIFSALQSKQSSKIMFDEIAGAVSDRPGGYTRILKLGFRAGDGTEEAFIELVDFSDFDPADRGSKKSKTRRSRSGRKRSGGTAEAVAVEAATADVAAAETQEAPEAEVVEEVVAETEATETDVVSEDTLVEEEVADTASESSDEETTADEELAEAEHVDTTSEADASGEEADKDEDAEESDEKKS